MDKYNEEKINNAFNKSTSFGSFMTYLKKEGVGSLEDDLAEYYINKKQNENIFKKNKREEQSEQDIYNEAILMDDDSYHGYKHIYTENAKSKNLKILTVKPLEESMEIIQSRGVPEYINTIAYRIVSNLTNEEKIVKYNQLGKEIDEDLLNLEYNTYRSLSGVCKRLRNDAREYTLQDAEEVKEEYFKNVFAKQVDLQMQDKKYGIDNVAHMFLEEWAFNNTFIKPYLETFSVKKQDLFIEMLSDHLARKVEKIQWKEKLDKMPVYPMFENEKQANQAKKQILKRAEEIDIELTKTEERNGR